MWVSQVVCSKKCKVFTFHDTFLIFSGVLRNISQCPKCNPSDLEVWRDWSTFFFCSFQQTLVGEEEEGEATCGTASLQSNCPNEDRSQLTCLFPYRVSVSRTIKPILETGCCAKQRPPDFFSQKVILICVSGIKWIIHFWKTLLYELFVFHPGFIQCNSTM